MRNLITKFKSYQLGIVFAALISLLTLASCTFLDEQVEQDISQLTGRCIALDEPENSMISAVQVLQSNKGSVASAMLENPDLEEGWQEKVDYYVEHDDRSTWLTELYIQPTSSFDVERPVINPVKIATNEEVKGVLLVRNEWKTPHSLRLVFLMNYQPIDVRQGSGEMYHYLDLPELLSGEEHTVEFSLPSLSQGFHQLSILGITDPASTSRDPEFRLIQSKSFFEIRKDIWVRIDRLPTQVVLFNHPEEGMLSSSQFGDIEVIANPEISTNEVLAQLNMESGESQCVSLRLFNCGPQCRNISETSAPYTGPYPLKIAVFWDDVMAGEYAFELQPSTPDNFTLDLEIQAPFEPGDYQFSVVAFPLPKYSQFNNQVDRTMFANTGFSRRVLVEVAP